MDGLTSDANKWKLWGEKFFGQPAQDSISSEFAPSHAILSQTTAELEKLSITAVIDSIFWFQNGLVSDEL